MIHWRIDTNLFLIHFREENFSIQANNECCGINGAHDWVNSDFGIVLEECCLSGNQYSRIEIANTRKQVNRTYCKSDEDGGVNFIGCEIQAKGIVVKRWYNFERLPQNRYVAVNDQAISGSVSELYLRAENIFTTMKRIRTAHCSGSTACFIERLKDNRTVVEMWFE